MLTFNTYAKVGVLIGVTVFTSSTVQSAPPPPPPHPVNYPDGITVVDKNGTFVGLIDTCTKGVALQCAVRRQISNGNWIAFMVQPRAIGNLSAVIGNNNILYSGSNCTGNTYAFTTAADMLRMSLISNVVISASSISVDVLMPSSAFIGTLNYNSVNAGPRMDDAGRFVATDCMNNTGTQASFSIYTLYSFTRATTLTFALPFSIK